VTSLVVVPVLSATLGVWWKDPGWWSVGAALLLGGYTWWSTERARKEARGAAEEQERFRQSQDSQNRRFQSRQNEIERRFHSTRDRVDRIDRDRRAFLRSFNSFESVPGIVDTGDVTARAQDVGRFFREKVRHYSACRSVFEEMKSDLTEEDRRKLEEMSGEVIQYFSDHFEVEIVRELVRKQSDFLGAARRAVNNRLEQLREELEDAGVGWRGQGGTSEQARVPSRLRGGSSQEEGRQEARGGTPQG